MLNNPNQSSPLKLARHKRGQSIHFVARAVGTTPGNLSRVENRKQSPSPGLAARLSKFFSQEITEIEILYPERFDAGGTQ